MADLQIGKIELGYFDYNWLWPITQEALKEKAAQIIEASKKRERLAIIREFVVQVNQLAEENIQKTNKLEGSHYAAMMKLLKDLEEEVNGKT